MPAVADARKALEPGSPLLFEQHGSNVMLQKLFTWGDVDAANLRLRLPRSATKRDRARWIYLPEWLIEAIESITVAAALDPMSSVAAGEPAQRGGG